MTQDEFKLLLGSVARRFPYERNLAENPERCQLYLDCFGERPADKVNEAFRRWHADNPDEPAPRLGDIKDILYDLLRPVSSFESRVAELRAHYEGWNRDEPGKWPTPSEAELRHYIETGRMSPLQNYVRALCAKPMKAVVKSVTPDYGDAL